MIMIEQQSWKRPHGPYPGNSQSRKFLVPVINPHVKCCRGAEIAYHKCKYKDNFKNEIMLNRNQGN